MKRTKKCLLKNAEEDFFASGDEEVFVDKTSPTNQDEKDKTGTELKTRVKTII